MSAPIDILLVDDEPRNLDALEAILEVRPIDLFVPATPIRALHCCSTNDVAAIVLDIKMPR